MLSVFDKTTMGTVLHPFLRKGDKFGILRKLCKVMNGVLFWGICSLLYKDVMDMRNMGAIKM